MPHHERTVCHRPAHSPSIREGAGNCRPNHSTPSEPLEPKYPNMKRGTLRAAARSGIGMKVLMALSAVVLVGYMLIHVLGNLLIFLGPSWINGWGALLHATGPLLWAARIVIFVAFVVHVVVGVA